MIRSRKSKRELRVSAEKEEKSLINKVGLTGGDNNIIKTMAGVNPISITTMDGATKGTKITITTTDGAAKAIRTTVGATITINNQEEAYGETPYKALTGFYKCKKDIKVKFITLSI